MTSTDPESGGEPERGELAARVPEASAAVPPAPPVPELTKPVSEPERIAALDVIRGMAVCGILLVNIESFGMVREARYDPGAAGGDGGLNNLVWLGTFLFADTKFIAIFTMLFGAGIAVFDQRRRERRARGAWAVYYRRMLFLLALGAAHGLFLWRGDILYFYAFWGLALYFAPRFPAIVLALVGLGLYTWHVQDFSQQLAAIGSGYSRWEQEIYQGGWMDQYAFRKQFERYYLIDVPFQFAPHLVGLMLIGMASYKTGFLAGRGWLWAYAIAAVGALAAGGAMMVSSTNLQHGFESAALARQFVWGSLLLSFGYIAAAVVAARTLGDWLVVLGLGAMGRMALTNYLMQSIICTTIFYGYGFGMFNRLSRVEQLGIVLGIWAFQMVFSALWIKVFRFGPFEWIWRTVSYWRFQPMIRRAPAAVRAPSPVPFLD